MNMACCYEDSTKDLSDKVSGHRRRDYRDLRTLAASGLCLGVRC